VASISILLLLISCRVGKFLHDRFVVSCSCFLLLLFISLVSYFCCPRVLSSFHSLSIFTRACRFNFDSVAFSFFVPKRGLMRFWSRRSRSVLLLLSSLMECRLDVMNDVASNALSSARVAFDSVAFDSVAFACFCFLTGVGK
jgi:hypothetical protein